MTDREFLDQIRRGYVQIGRGCLEIARAIERRYGVPGQRVTPASGVIHKDQYPNGEVQSVGTDS